MATFAAARTVLRSTSAARNGAAARFASKPKSSPSASPFRNYAANTNKSLSQSILLRSPVEMSFGLESMMPYHMVTASALMTSMLSISRGSYGWLLAACNDDV